MAVDLQTLRAAAISTVAALQLDQCVRAASKLGTHDGGANWEYNHVTWQSRRLMIRSTEGAGTNSASVWIDTPGQYEAIVARDDAKGLDQMPGLRVYEFSDHGRGKLTTYRAGWWVPVVMELAFQFHQRDAVDKLLRENAQVYREALDFTPLPD